MIVGIVGSRTFTDFKKLCDNVESLGLKITGIISGGAAGADTLAEMFASKYNIPITVIRPDWNKNGKAAGFIRNGEIVAKSDVILAFWDGVSKGTEDTIKKAARYKKTTIIIYI